MTSAAVLAELKSPGFELEGVTGNIQFNGGDRVGATYSISNFQFGTGGDPVLKKVGEWSDSVSYSADLEYGFGNRQLSTRVTSPPLDNIECDPFLVVEDGVVRAAKCMSA